MQGRLRHPHTKRMWPNNTNEPGMMIDTILLMFNLCVLAYDTQPRFCGGLLGMRAALSARQLINIFSHNLALTGRIIALMSCAAMYCACAHCAFQHSWQPSVTKVFTIQYASYCLQQTPQWRSLCNILVRFTILEEQLML